MAASRTYRLPEETMVALTVEEIKGLFARIKDLRDRALFLLAYRHALRVSEVRCLRWSDIYWPDRILTVRRLKKSLQTRQRIPDDAWNGLNTWKKHAPKGPLVFAGLNGQPITRQAVDKRMRLYARHLSPEKRHFHCLKHSCATHLLNISGNVSSVQTWLGHRSINNTMLYAKLLTETQERIMKDAWAKLPQL